MSGPGDVQPPDPRHVLAVAVRQLGRVRVTARELDQVTRGKLAIRQDEAGGWVFEWREA